MNAFSLISGPFAEDFFPFSLNRSVADIRCGILTIREKWSLYLQNSESLPNGLSVPANILPDADLVRSLLSSNPDLPLRNSIKLSNLTDILRYHEIEFKKDFHLITSGRVSAPVSSTNRLTGTNIFLEPGAILEHCYLNSAEGPIYIGKDALIMEGSMIRGPFAIGEKGVVKMGSKIYGATAAGPNCVLGGEIKNSIFFGNSNKSHDGYLGDSIIGEYCNIGAGGSCSNLKNSLGQIKLWNPLKKSFLNGGLKCGLIMGDYSRSAINTSFTTGAVVGISCHVFGNGPTPGYLPSFSWGFNNEVYSFDKAIDHIIKWKKLKGHEIGAEEIKQLKTIFDHQNKLK
jgi:UDP-N-acetylglucosamine diphosphorylase/glucosamine-1-phosphate N-acetyltransferase